MTSSCNVLKRHVQMACRDGLTHIADQANKARVSQAAALRKQKVWRNWALGMRPLSEDEITERLAATHAGHNNEYHRKHAYLVRMIRAANMCASDTMHLTVDDAAVLRTWLTDESLASVDSEVGRTAGKSV